MSELATSTTRPVPEQWEELYGLASRVDIHPMVESRGLKALGKAIRTLDDLPLKNNSYFALSLAVCGFARHLQTPEARQEIVDRGAQQLLARSNNMKAFNTRGFQLDKAFQPAISAGYKSLDRPTRLLSNYLIATRSERRRYYWGAPVDSKTRDQSVRREVVANIRKNNGQTLTESRLGAIAISPQGIIDTILKARGVDMSAGDIPSKKDLKKLRDVSVNITARRMCTVTSSQSTGESGPVIDVEDDIVSFIRPNSLPNFFSPKSNPRYEVNAVPMLCPALHVRGVVPLAMDLTIDMLKQARKQLV
jgi:hypothetical protein